jgi:hypothetical protein
MHIDRRLAGPHRQPIEPALRLFHSARLTMNHAFVAWLNTRPDAADIDLEVHGSTAVLHQLANLARGDSS